MGDLSESRTPDAAKPSIILTSHLLTTLTLLLPKAAAGQDTLQLTTDQAAAHVGSHATVCGLVVSARYAGQSRGSPTFLNFDRPFPNQPFTVVIWGDDRARSPTPPERAYRDQRVCATGTIDEYRGVPQIVAR